MIYIDPPYNTGSDGFVYNDSRKYTPEQISALTGESLEDAKRIDSFISSNASTHSAWLTFMYPRLKVARELLRDDGVIFISIDDNEAAQLKLLCDEVFGEGNFIAELIWSLGTGTQAGHFVRAHETIFVYSRDKNSVPNFAGGNGIIEHSALKKISIKNPESHFKFPAGTRWDAPDDYELKASWGGAEQMILVDGIMKARDGKLLHDVVLGAGYAQKNQMKNWFSGKETFDSKGQKVLNFYFNRNGILRYEKERSVINPATVLNNIASTKNGSDEINTLFGSKLFSFPKPSDLIKFLIHIATSGNDLILDFFAGSGTTAHAVMQQNAEDAENGQPGKRQYICVQIDEPTDAKSEARKAGYDTIYQITRARIEKAAAKIRNDYPDFDGDLGFQEYFIADLPEHFDSNYENAVEGDLIAKALQLSEQDCRNLLCTWAVHDGMPLTEQPQAVDLCAYTAWQYADNLYLLNQEFGAEQLAAFLRRLDDVQDDFSISRIIALGHQFNSASLLELSEAVAQYAPKKGHRLSLHIRHGVED